MVKPHLPSDAIDAYCIAASDRRQRELPAPQAPSSQFGRAVLLTADQRGAADCGVAIIREMK